MSRPRITEHKPHLVEYEIETAQGDEGFIAFARAGNLIYVSTKTEFDEVEECLTMEQAKHLIGWLERNVLVGPEMGMAR